MFGDEPEETPADEEPPEAEEPSEADEEAAFRTWWAQLPDFIKPTYPFDLPPDRMPFAQEVFTLEGAPQHCPAAACRRAGRCQGGDGPPCFRADREDLRQVLFLWWMMLYEGLSQEDYAAALHGWSNRYAWPEASPAEAQSTGKRRSKRTR